MGRYNVILVEDEEIVAIDIGHRLKKLGYDLLAHLTTGHAAVAAARQLSADVILMDIGLSGAMDGIEAARRIREAVGVPVVYLTASAEETTVERAKATEPEGYLLKPPTDEELRVAIELAVHRHRLEAAREQRRAQAVAAAGRAGDFVPGLWQFHATRARLITPGGVEVPLSAQEATVIGLFASVPGENVRREDIFAKLEQPNDRSAHVRLEALISRLRRKTRRVDPTAELPLRARQSQGYAFLAEIIR